MRGIDLLLILFAYLLGSIASAILVSRAMGLPDPRTLGSGNPGATNVLRTGNKKAAALTLLGDLLKGVIPVVAARLADASPLAISLVAAAAFAGHLFPIFFGFKGGKGVATSLGVLLALSWPTGLAAAATWLVMAKVVRISSLSALTAAVFAPVYMWLFSPEPAYTVMALIMSLVLVWRHKSNIQNLLAGKESKIGSKAG